VYGTRSPIQADSAFQVSNEDGSGGSPRPKRLVIPCGWRIRHVCPMEPDQILQEYGLHDVRIDMKRRAPSAFESPHAACFCRKDSWIVEIVGEPEDYLAFHELMHIVLEVTNRRIETDYPDVQIKAYLFELKNLFDDYLIETEVQRRFGETYCPTYRALRCAESSTLRLVSSNIQPIVLLLDFLSIRNICTNVYPGLQGAPAAQVCASVIKSARLDAVVAACRDYTFGLTPAMYVEGISNIHAALTDSRLSVDTRGNVRLSKRYTKQFLSDVSGIPEMLRRAM